MQHCALRATPGVPHQSHPSLAPRKPARLELSAGSVPASAPKSSPKHSLSLENRPVFPVKRARASPESKTFEVPLRFHEKYKIGQNVFKKSEKINVALDKLGIKYQAVPPLDDPCLGVGLLRKLFYFNISLAEEKALQNHIEKSTAKFSPIIWKELLIYRNFVEKVLVYYTMKLISKQSTADSKSIFVDFSSNLISYKKLAKIMLSVQDHAKSVFTSLEKLFADQFAEWEMSDAKASKDTLRKYFVNELFKNRLVWIALNHMLIKFGKLAAPFSFPSLFKKLTSLSNFANSKPEFSIKSPLKSPMPKELPLLRRGRKNDEVFSTRNLQVTEESLELEQSIEEFVKNFNLQRRKIDAAAFDQDLSKFLVSNTK